MIKTKKKQTSIEIDLTGEQGNAYVLLGIASSLAKQLGYSSQEQKELLTDMRSADYEHLVATLDKHFGHFVTMYR